MCSAVPESAAVNIGQQGAASNFANPEKVIDALVTLNADLKKGEFETTAEFQARKERLRPPNPSVTFLCESEDAEFQYDADRKVFSVTPKAEVRRLSEDGGNQDVQLASLRLIRKEIDSRDYVGTNAFGSTTEVHSVSYREYGIILADDSVIAPVQGGTPTTFSLSMDVQQARALKLFLRLALIGTILDPKVYTDMTLVNATIHDPNELTIKSFFIPFTVTEAQVIDIRSGKTLKAFRNDGKGEHGGVQHTASDVKSSPSLVKAVQLSTQRRTEPIILSQVKPVYPPLAKSARVEGPVEFEIRVSYDGSISGIRLISGHPLLVNAAHQAVEQYKFKAGTINGLVAEMSIRTTVFFSLH